MVTRVLPGVNYSVGLCAAWGVHLREGGGDYNPLFGPQLFMSVSHYRRTVLIRPIVPNSSNNNKSGNL
jgi:hypothetical protein